MSDVIFFSLLRLISIALILFSLIAILIFHHGRFPSTKTPIRCRRLAHVGAFPCPPSVDVSAPTRPFPGGVSGQLPPTPGQQ